MQSSIGGLKDINTHNSPFYMGWQPLARINEATGKK